MWINSSVDRRPIVSTKLFASISSHGRNYSRFGIHSPDSVMLIVYYDAVSVVVEYNVTTGFYSVEQSFRGRPPVSDRGIGFTPTAGHSIDYSTLLIHPADTTVTLINNKEVSNSVKS